jgi:hypothetical protein
MQLLLSQQHEYSYDLSLFKYKLIENYQEIELLHDFTTGMQYKYNSISGRCQASALEHPNKGNFDSTVDIDASDPKQLKLKTPSQFFSIDGTKPIYSGQVCYKLGTFTIWVVNE